MNINPAFLKKQNNPQDNRQTLTQHFMINQPMYDLTPPQPNSHPKAYHYSLDPSRYYSHKFTPLYLSNCKPLLIDCDVGLPVQQLIMFSHLYNNNNKKNKRQSSLEYKSSIGINNNNNIQQQQQQQYFNTKTKNKQQYQQQSQQQQKEDQLDLQDEMLINEIILSQEQIVQIKRQIQIQKKRKRNRNRNRAGINNEQNNTKENKYVKSQEMQQQQC